MRGGLPAQGSRATRFHILENTGHLGASLHQVSQENSINNRPSIELTVLPDCELLHGWTLVFNTIICLSDHQGSVSNPTKIGVPDSKDH